MTYPNHTYYIPSHRKVYGEYAGDKDTIALLYAVFMRHLGHDEPKRFDGSSIWNPESPETSRIRVCVGCGGRGDVFTIVDADGVDGQWQTIT